MEDNLLIIISLILFLLFLKYLKPRRENFQTTPGNRIMTLDEDGNINGTVNDVVRRSKPDFAGGNDGSAGGDTFTVAE